MLFWTQRTFIFQFHTRIVAQKQCRNVKLHSIQDISYGFILICFGNKARWCLDTFKTSRIKRIKLLFYGVQSPVLTLTDCVTPGLLQLYDL